MKNAILFIFTCILSMAAESYAQQVRVSINIQNGSIYDVVSEIEKQTDFMFFYKSDDISNDLRVNIRATNLTVPEILDETTKDTDLAYTINNKVILIARKTNLISQQSPYKITGSVADDKGEPLAGAMIAEKGGMNGTVTDVEGQFLLNVTAGAVLQISYIGYVNQEIAIGDRTTLNIIMIEDAVNLEEVVVVGYGTQKKTSLTAAVGTIKGEELVSTPVSNISNTLSGRIAGLVTAQTSGAIGKDETAIRIRGISTTNGNTAPLVVIDGIPRDIALLNQLNSNTIASVNVLKDAAAVAPYGMAGANGVILVTTKDGEKGKSQLYYSGYMGFSRPTVIGKTLNAYEFVLMYNEAMKNQNPNGQPPYSAEDIAGFRASVDGVPGADYDKYPSSDASAYLFDNNAPMYNHNLSLSGGVENFNYYLGLGYTRQEGHWNTVYLNRYTLDLSLEAKPTTTTKVGFKMNGINQKFHEPRIDEMTIHKRVYSYLPVDAITYTNGLPANSRKNNLDAMMADDEYMDTDELKIFTQLFVEQELNFIKGLKFKGVVSFDPSNMFSKDWRQPYPTYYTVNTSVTPYQYVPTID
ncbi:MAG: SusC/RagA family TonB-linked outer membrane protein, partial [Bacteroidales bacterium]|nr:SusC/RagA family TonB-linked outer membrane protein [Bacteroidales bacterium]